MELTKFLNKKDTVIYKDNEAVGGVIDFSMRSGVVSQLNRSTQGLYEILSGVPYDYVTESLCYIITLKQYTRDFKGFGESNFTLRFVSGENEKSFSGCKVKSEETATDNNGRLITVSEIYAERVC